MAPPGDAPAAGVEGGGRGRVGADGLRAAVLTDGPADRLVFEGFVGWRLAPAPRPGDAVLMDNLSRHKSPLSRHKSPAAPEAIAAAEAEAWFLPAYSPGLNPAEKVFAKVKGLLRAAKARSVTALYDAVAAPLRRVTPDDCRNRFRSRGYAATSKSKML